MSLLQAHSRNDYLGNNSTATYAFTFRVQSASQLKVIKLDTLANETVLSLNTDFTVSGVGAASGGTITLTAGNLPLNYRLAILRVVPLTQETDIRNQGAFYPEIHEDVFDRLTAIDQQQQDAIDRSLRLSEAINPGSFEMELPASVVANPNATIVVNATGNGLGVGPTTTAIINSEANANAASASASAAAASASAAAASAVQSAANAAAGLWKDVVFLTAASSPVNIVDSNKGNLYVIDASAGNVIINLPLISSLDLSQGWSIGVKKSDSSGNTITINANAADAIEGASNFVLNRQNFGATLLPDIDPVPADAWTAVYFGDVRNLYSPTIYTPTVDVMTIDGQAATPANPSAGFYKTYIKDIDSKMYVLKSDGTEIQIGSGAGGGINYITNPDADAATTGWATYSGGTTTPTSGAGGSPTLTLTRTTTSPLRGLGSFLITKAASNQQGQGVSDDFTIDLSDRFSVLRGSFEYQIASGTYSDDVLEVFIYDVTNAALIPCTPSKLKNSGLVEKFFFEFQTSGSTSYRFIIHCASTSTAAFTMKLDNFAIGPNSRATGGVRGPVGSVIAHASLTAPMGYILADGAAVSRTNYAKLFSVIGTTYGVGDGSTTFNLPDLRGIFIRGQGSQTISSIVYSGTLGTKQTDQMQGHKHFNVLAPQATGSGDGVPQSPQSGETTRGTSGGNPSSDGTNGTPRTGAETRPANIALAYFICFDDGVSVSSDADTRVIAAIIGGVPQSAYTAGTPIIFPTVQQDTHAAYNATTGEYTAPSTGFYLVGASGDTDVAANNRVDTYVDGVAQAGLLCNTNAGRFHGFQTVFVNAGQKITIRCGANWSAAATVGDWFFSVQKLSGPSQIMASESIAVKYTDSSAAAISTSTAVYKFLTKEVDSHGSYSTATGLFTCPANGVYKIDAHLSHVTNLTTSQQCDILIYKNGVSIKRHTMFGNATATRKSLILSDLVRLVPGDTIGIYASSDVATNAVNDVQYNSFSIVRAGI